MKISFLFGVAALIFMGGALLYSVRIKNTQKNNAVLVVGTASGYAPFVSMNEQGQYEGFDIDVAQAVAQKMNKTLELKDLGSMPALFTALEQGMVDVLIWGISITKPRLEKVSMVHYQGEVVDSRFLLFWQTMPESITSIFDMQGKVVAVEPASSEDAILQKYDFITPLPVDKIDDALLSIQYGKCDAAFVEPTIAKKFANKYPEVKTLRVQLNQEDYVQGCGIVIKKDNTQLTQEIERVVAALKADGTITALEKKWGLAS